MALGFASIITLRAAVENTSLLDDFQVDVWDVAQGLPQNTVTAITQTPDGYLWLGTPNGLACFDGVRFQVFDRFSSPALPGHHVNVLLATPDGDLWVGCEEATIRLHRGRFEAVGGTNSAGCRSLARTADGKIWIGTDNGLLVWQDGQVRAVQTMEIPASGPVNGLVAVGTNSVWALAGGHLFKVGGNPLSVTPLKTIPDSRSGLAVSSARNVWLFGTKLVRQAAEAAPLPESPATGLAPGDTISAVCERSNGEVWLGTRKGKLKRLIGQVISYDLSAWAGASAVRCLFEDREQNLWVGTESGGLLRIKVRKVRVYGTGDSLPGGPIAGLCPDGRQQFWVACESDGIQHWQNGQFTRFTANDALPTNALFWCVLQTRDGSLWMGTEGAGLLRWRHQQLDRFGPTQGVSEPAIHALCEDPDGSLWFGGRDGGLYHQTDAGCERLGAAEGFAGRNISSIVADPEGGLWIGSNGDGLYRFAGGKFSHFTQADGLGSDEVRTLHLDRQGGLWAGTSGGLTRIKAGQIFNFSTRQGLWDNVISQIVEDDLDPVADNHQMWFGSNRGIFRVAQASFEALVEGKIATLESVVYGRSEGMDCLECTGGFGPAGLVERPTPNQTAVNSRLWFSTQRGLVRVDPIRLIGMARGISGDHLVFGRAELHLGSGDRLFDLGDVVAGGNGFGTGNGYGIWAFNGVVEQSSRVGNGTDSGTTSNARYHRTSLPFVDGVFIPNGGISPDHLVVISSTGLKVELPETAGVAWGPIRSGLRPLPMDVFDPSDWTTFGQKFVWLPGDQGITFDLDAIRQATGLSVNRFTALAGNLHIGPASFHVFLDGQLVARRSGVVRDSDQLERGIFPIDVEIPPAARFLTLVSTDDKDDIGLFNLQPPPVTIEEVLADGVAQPPNGELPSALRTNAVAGTLHPAFATLTLAPGSGRLEFEYAALSLVSPEKVRFRCRLEPVEKDWVEMGARRVASYNHLRPGNYSFHVSACNEDRVWNEAGASVAIVLQPYFWQTWWFTPLWGGALIAVVASMVGMVVRRRHQRRVARLEHLHAIASERMRIARDIHDDLGASLTHIALLSELAQTDLAEPEQARPHLDLIFTTARKVARSVDEIVWAISPKNDALETSVAYICKGAEDYLRAAGINCQLERPETLPARSLSSSVRHHLYLTLREALNNVVKHAAATEVQLRLSATTDSLTVVMADNGHGFDPDAGACGPTAAASSRIREGLGSMAHRMETVGGHFELQSQPGRGTVIRLTVPFQPEEK